MFRSKQELDIKVRDVLSKIDSENERLLRCLQFAKWYMGLRDYETALKYLDQYVSVPTLQKQDQAHSLIGDIYSMTNRPEDALLHYKRSYELVKSRNVLSKICGLIQNGHGIHENSHSKAMWMDLLKSTQCLEDERLMSGDSFAVLSFDTPTRPSTSSSPHVSSGIPVATKSKSTLSAFSSSAIFGSMSNDRSPTPTASQDNMKTKIQSLVKANQATVDQHVALLQFYLTDEELEEGAFHVHKHMLKFCSSYKFLEKAATLLEKATERPSGTSANRLTEAEKSATLLFVMENLVSFLLLDKLEDEAYGIIRSKRLEFAADWLLKLDQALYRKERSVKASHLECWWLPFVKHLQCQVAMFFGILAYSRSSTTAERKSILACFSLASIFAVDQPISLVKIRESTLKQRIFVESSFRMLLSDRILRESSNATLTPELKRQIFKKALQERASCLALFGTSCFLNFSHKDATGIRDGLSSKLFWLYALSAQYLYPDCLDFQLWIQIQIGNKLSTKKEDEYYVLHSVVFESLPFGSVRAGGGNLEADNISQMDVDAFLTASVYLCYQTLNESPGPLAPFFSQTLVTSEQSKWWTYAYRLTHDCTATGSTNWRVSQYRSVISRGLEMIRNNGKTMPIFLLHLLGTAYCRSAFEIEKDSFCRQFLSPGVSMDIASTMFFCAADAYLGMLLEVLETGDAGFIRFFDINKFPSFKDPDSIKETANFIVGCRAMVNENYDTAIAHFEQTNSMEGAFYAAKLYKQLADEERVTGSDGQGRFKALLLKAQELLYVSIDQKDQKSKQQLLNKVPNEDKVPVPFVNVCIQHGDLYVLLDEIEKELNAMIVAPNNKSFNELVDENSFNENTLEPESDHNRSGAEGDVGFVIRTPQVKNRPSTSNENGLHISNGAPAEEPSYFVGCSTPRRSVAERNSPVSFSTFVDENKFVNTLTEILEQSSAIQDYLAEVSDEIKDLNDRFENLKKSRRITVRRTGSDRR